MDLNYIKCVVSKILNKEHTSTERRRIIDYHDRIQFCCTYCGDSFNNERSKRGNIWFNRLIYVCFNCDKKISFDKFLKDHNEMVDPDKKMEIIDHLSTNLTYRDYKDDVFDAQFEDLIDLDKLTEAFNVKKVSPIYDFQPVDPKSGVFKYLVNRGITPDKQNNIYQAKFAKGEDGFEHIICLLNRRGDKIVGMQIRNLKGGNRRFFLIYNFESLHNWVYGLESDNMDIVKMVMYNKISYFFNIFNVDFNSTITIFEGYLDSLFFPNAIGVVGVNTDMKFVEDNNLDIRYMYDNDTAGYKKSIEKIKMGIPVFLWNKLFEHVVDKKGARDPYKLEYRMKKIKDLNQLAVIVDKPYSKLELEDFFSNDIFDIKYIPDVKGIYRKKYGNKNTR